MSLKFYYKIISDAIKAIRLKLEMFFECGYDTKHELSDRTFECSNCHITEDMDLHGAKNMVLYYHEVCCDKEKQPAGTVGLKPGRKIKYKKSYKGLLKTGSSVAFSN